jgi:asparagine synthase (glutamine-hydrolysing)
MCGIFGQLNWHGADVALIERMAQRVAHRGPDGYSVHQGGALAFGAGRLAIIDLAAPPGIVYNEDRRISIAFNGEIYNYRPIRAELEQAGHRFYTQTDTEVIVHGYEQWGEGIIEKLRGMFGFAIWDANTETLLIARDRLGEKPLYYMQRENGELLFSSETKALFEHPDVRPVVNTDALAYYLTLGYTPPPMTMFAGIRKLAAGEYLRATRQGVEIQRYWQPEMHTRQMDLNYDEAVKTVRRAVFDAVESRMISDVPIGALLSGGVDSTAVVAIMQRAVTQPLKTFTVGFDFEAGSVGDQKFNVDMHYAEQAAQHIGTDHHRITIKDESLADLLPHLIYHMDEPVAQHSIIQTVYVAALARHTGVPVLLSGDAGDELFLGYGHYQADRLLERFLTLPALLRDNALLPVMARIGRYKDLARKARAADPTTRYLEWMRVFTQDEASALITDPQRAACVQTSLASVLAPLLAAPDTAYFADRIAFASLSLWVPEDSNMRVDKMSMAMSIESRAPLEDHLLAELALTLPLEYKLRGGTFKKVFKDAVRDLVPQAILDRPKWGFIPPTSDWLRTVLRPLVDRYLSREYVTAAGMVNPDIVVRLMDEHMSKRGYHLKPLWSLLTLHLWHAIYIEGSLKIGTPLTPADVVAQAKIR